MSFLNPGDIAPDFAVKNQDGKEIRLSDYKGKKVVLYFYPKDNTPGCTNEACDLRDHHTELQQKGFVVLGVSADNEKSHTKFAGKYKLPFDLLADTEKTIMNAYGAWGEKSLYGKKYMGILRTTYIIDEDGRVEKVITKVDTKNPTKQILDELGIS